MTHMILMYWNEFLVVAAIHLLAVMSPGPDFAMVVRSSLVYNRRVGLWSAVGLGLGILVHVLYSLVGIGLIIAKSVVLFTTIKWAGALYLIYIGYKSLRAQPIQISTARPEIVGNALHQAAAPEHLSIFKAIRLGFLTNVLNPKATLFFLSLFTQVISPQTPIVVQLLYGTEMVVATTVWFGLVALVLSHQSIRVVYQRWQHWCERVFGVVLIALGLKIALSTTE